MENSLHYKLRICHTNCQKSIVIDIKSKTDLRPGEPKILEFLAEHEPCEQKVIAEVPMAEMTDFSAFLRQTTQGRGSYVFDFARYEQCPPQVAEKVISAAKPE